MHLSKYFIHLKKNLSQRPFSWAGDLKPKRNGNALTGFLQISVHQEIYFITWKTHFLKHKHSKEKLLKLFIEAIFFAFFASLQDSAWGWAKELLRETFKDTVS